MTAQRKIDVNRQQTKEIGKTGQEKTAKEQRETSIANGDCRSKGLEQ